jgi:hypothetical protein
MTGLMPDDPCPIEVGTEGTVVGIGAKLQGRTQIDVEWDNGRTLFLLDSDPFTVAKCNTPTREGENST